MISSVSLEVALQRMNLSLVDVQVKAPYLRGTKLMTARPPDIEI